MRSSRGSGSLHRADITHIMRTSRAAARRHHAAAAHSSALHFETGSSSSAEIHWGEDSEASSSEETRSPEKMARRYTFALLCECG
ncbi:hypothetical protein STEG23_028448 [Scotinomys teguina]